MTSTYRLQISPKFTLDAAVSVVDYLARLGVSAVYTSPLLTASPGSTHGYDVVDPTGASAELGGEEARRRLVSTAQASGLSVVVDIVPNHMSVEVPSANPWWWDVLRHGPDSAYARYFDVDWSRGRILLPVLGSDSLDDLSVRDDRLVYFEHEFPLAPGTAGGTPREVHDRQHYRLVNWREGNAELTYRRFFDITTLAGVRVEDPAVFEATHGEVLRWVRAGEVAGLRVDHPDGLADPGAYMRRLRAEAPDAWLVVEKILAVDESLPASWPVDGTTGYDALREICGVFVDPAGEPALTALAHLGGGLRPPDNQPTGEHRHNPAAETHPVDNSAERGLRPPEIQRTGEHRQESARGAEAVDNPVADGGPVDNPRGLSGPSGSVETGGRRPTLHEVETECRRLITRTSLVAEMRRIAVLANVAPEAIAEIMVAFPVYRSYLPEGLDNWTAAVSGAKQANPDLADDIDSVDHAVRTDPRGELATRIQQTSGMVVAKGVEDTAFYRWNRFVALNEVGGAPDRFGVTPDEFHTRAAARAAGWPRTMTTLSTHDTKRSEDVRARLAVLSEIPDEWAATVTRWSAKHGIDEPSLNDLAWQSLVGAWPISADRLRAYLDKAAKEAKVRTSWTDHDEAFEAAVAEWPDKVIADLGAEIEEFVARIAGPGWSNALGQKIVQLAGPGVPDVYQGTDLFDLSLVDPDNRRPVDFAARQRFLSRLEDGWLPDVDDTGAAKLHVVRQVLRLRRDRPDLFTGYRPLAAEGPAAEHVLAFARSPELVVVATRLPVRLARNGWRESALPLPAGPGTWRNLLTGNPVDVGPEPRCAALADLLSRYPVALLLRGNR
ncbi:alpha-amylase family glycosyl hydrolase [Actinophytocola sp. NPDC049390]|uniref:alpha-amylase family glycosyl hydrolase n=1 Tax=Actinophytocola sp. NPDC049390 TaxID=3363894 RepID=UPI0037A78FEE